MAKKSRTLDLLEELTPKINKQITPNEFSKKYNESYWELRAIQTGTLEFVVNADTPNQNDVKMYIIPNQSFNKNENDDYYSIITIAYNQKQQKTVSNYAVDNSTNILNNYGIDVNLIYSELNDNAQLEDCLTISQTELVCDTLASNINIIMAACTNQQTLNDVIYEILTPLTLDDIDVEWD